MAFLHSLTAFALTRRIRNIMSNTTFDCASLQKFADFFSLNTTNITTAVGVCPEKCSLAWGTGSPDLSGIGVFASYIFHLAVCLLIGPCYAIIHR